MVVRVAQYRTHYRRKDEPIWAVSSRRRRTLAAHRVFEQDIYGSIVW